MTKKHCCSIMENQIEWECNQHKDPYDCPDAILSYFPAFDEYGIIVHDGGTAKK